MLNYFKADLYRIKKERLSLVPLCLLLLFGSLFAYLYRSDTSQTVAENLVKAWTPVLPLFFVTPAKIFLGEDLTNRTINTVLIKSQNRLRVFVYKWGMTLALSLVYLLIALVVTSVAHHLFSGMANYSSILTYLWYQLPLYTVIASLCALIFTFFDRIYQSYLVYIIIALLFDQLFSLMMGMLFQTDKLAPYMMFNQLGQIDITGTYLTPTSMVALLFSVVYGLAGYLLFSKREFK